jgi:hypothetical protein
LTDEIAPRLKKALQLQYPPLRYISSDNQLSRLGDAVVNYMASVSETLRQGVPTGLRVDNATLRNAVRESGLRERLSHRRDRHMLGDAAEALIAYGFIQGGMTMEECVDVILRCESLQDGITQVLRLAMERTGIGR